MEISSAFRRSAGRSKRIAGFKTFPLAVFCCPHERLECWSDIIGRSFAISHRLIHVTNVWCHILQEPTIVRGLSDFYSNNLLFGTHNNNSIHSLHCCCSVGGAFQFQWPEKPWEKKKPPSSHSWRADDEKFKEEIVQLSLLCGFHSSPAQQQCCSSMIGFPWTNKPGDWALK